MTSETILLGILLLSTPGPADSAVSAGDMFDMTSLILSAGALIVAIVALAHTLTARPRIVLDVYESAGMDGVARGQILVVLNAGRRAACLSRVGLVVSRERIVYHRDTIEFDGQSMQTPTLPAVLQPGEVAEFPMPADLLDSIDGTEARYRVTMVRSSRPFSSRASYVHREVSRAWTPTGRELPGFSIAHL